MAIYKSSFNKKNKKNVKEKPVKEQKLKSNGKKFKLNVPLLILIVSLLLFFVCVLPNNFLKSFLLGTFGLSVYPLTIIGAFFSSVFLGKKKYNVKKRYVVYLSIALSIIWFIIHLILTSKLSLDSLGGYLSQTYKAKTTAGGVVFSLISYPLTKFLTYVGAYIVCAITLAIFVGLIIDYINVEKTTGHAENKTKFDFSNIDDFNLDENEDFKVLSKEEQNKQNAKVKLGLKTESSIISSSMPSYDVNLESEHPMSKRDYILTPLDPILPTEDTTNMFTQNEQPNIHHQEIKTEPVEEKSVEEVETYDNNSKNIEEKDDMFVEDEDISGYETSFEMEADEPNETEEVNYEEELEDLNENVENFENENQETTNEQVEEIIADTSVNEYIDEYADNKDDYGLGETVSSELVSPSVDISKFNLPTHAEETKQEEPIKEHVKLEIPPYIAPPVDLLNFLENPVKVNDEELQDNIERLEQVLEDFKVPAKVNNVQVGPAVTRYELTMPRGISVNKVATMADDIAMTLASNGSIRVEAPIPGKNSVGIEVPNKQVSPVSLRELIDSEDFRNRQNPLSFVLGKDINGDIMFCNLDKMPHLLVAGSTGSGKSVCLNAMLLSMCYKAGPQDLRLVLVDPKMVEFSKYNGLPHLLIPDVITNKNMTINALDWAINEMQRRYELLTKCSVANIIEFNKREAVRSGREEKLPYIVIVVDELYDLMMEAKREIDDRIGRLAAKARAAGIHLVLATQRPSVDVITGTIKANLPSRIAFALTNYMDSKTVLDGGGAERLLGKGDMLFKPMDKPEPKRIQGAFVSNEEILKVIQFIKDNNKPVYDEGAGSAIKNAGQEKTQNMELGSQKDGEFDPVLKDALKWFIQVKQASASMIARRFSVGFNRAGRIMDQMEDAGFIGHQDGSKPRAVLITMEEFKAIFKDEE